MCQKSLHALGLIGNMEGLPKMAEEWQWANVPGTYENG